MNEAGTSGPSSSPPPIPRTTKRGMPVAGKVTLILALAFCAFVAFRLVQLAFFVREHPSELAPGQAAFREANRLIIGTQGQLGHGNSPEAMAMATRYARDIKALRDEFFSKGKGSKDAFAMLTRGDFPTYCRLSSNACVIMVHVPELRRFTPDAKESLAGLAWTAAQTILADGLTHPPSQLVVGVKGEIKYEAIMIGASVPGPDAPDDGIQTRGSGILAMEMFYPYFVSEDAAPR